MATTPADLCSHCGARAVRRRSRSDWTMPYRMLSALPITAEFLIPTCCKCGADSLDEKTAAALADVIPEAFAKELRRRGRDAVAKVCKYISQRRLEKLLGLSQGYLSRLYAAKGTPSPALVALLTLLAHDPRPRLAEVQQDWDEPYPCDHTEVARLCSSCRAPLSRRGA